MSSQDLINIIVKCLIKLVNNSILRLNLKFIFLKFVSQVLVCFVAFQVHPNNLSNRPTFIGYQMMTCITYRGGEYPYTSIPHMLSPYLLEMEHEEYKFLLEKYAEYKSSEEVLALADKGFDADPITKKLNDTKDHYPWFSSHLQCLCYLTGDPSEYAKSVKMRSVNSGADTIRTTWYGDSTSIPEEEAIEIAKLMVSFGAKANIPNYFKETLMETLQKVGDITSRVNNSNFIAYMKTLQK